MTLLPSPSSPPSLQFQLRLTHALSSTTCVVLSDVNPGLAFKINELSIQTTKTTALKPIYRKHYAAHASAVAAYHGSLPKSTGRTYKMGRRCCCWPAKVANNAYTHPEKSD